jgi:ABC-type antimicrobial peptide transport system permease subunit
VQKLPYDLADDEIVMPYTKYNAIFGTKYTEKTLSTFVPHTVSLQQYRYYDVGNQSLLYEKELKIVALVVSKTAPNVPTFFANENLINEFSHNTVFVAGLYFDGIDQIETVIKQSSVLEHSKNSVLLDGIYTMMRAVEVFVPIFRLLSAFLYVGMICILINFATRMIRNKLHTIGIMKALGTKNRSLAIMFGLQIALIALLTCLLSSLGYLLFAGVANDLLIHSLETLSPQRIIIELSVLTYNPYIALNNCILIAALSFISMIAPLIHIKKIKPVKIIKTKE